MTPLEQQRNDVFLRHYVAHEESLRGFVRSLVPTREDAREVMQEVAAVLWRKFEDISSPDDFRRWAFGVARFEALDFLRKRSRDRHCFGDDALRILAEEAEQEAATLDAERQALEQCLSRLPESQRALVEAAYAPGSRMDALANQSGRSVTALYKTLHRIRIALMACTEQALAQEAAR
jgi:RNA polymerase sigma-70 factor (ECF subfamily)